MKVTAQNKVSAAQLENLTPLEAKRLAAELEGRPAPPLTSQEREHLSAQERLEKLKANKGKTIHTVVIGGEEWYIREHSYGGLLQLGMRAGTQSGSSYTKDVVLRGVCVSPDSTEPYFTEEILDEFMNEVSASALMVELVGEINKINVGIFPPNPEAPSLA